MLNTSFSPWPSFNQEEAEAVQKVLLSNQVNYWTGSEGRTFETEFAAWAGSQHAIALANGTVALEIALRALGIGSGDEVIVSPRTFLASASSIIQVGAKPVFADVDLNSQNITAETIATVLTPHIRAIICVHLAGWPCDMAPIMDLANQHQLKVIEDCAQAHGARYQGQSVGTIGDIGCWSFCQDKIMSTGGEGGMVTTNDDTLWRTMWAHKDHGKSYAAVHEREHPPGFRWLHEDFGTNARMTEMQAAIGRIQLQRMSEWTRLRTAHAAALTQALTPYAGPNGCIRLTSFHCHRGCPSGADSQSCKLNCIHAYYKYYCFVRPENLTPGWNRERIIEAINTAGVPCYAGSCSEVYLEKAFDDTSYRPVQRLPSAKILGETSLMFLVHPTLTSAEINKTTHVITSVLQQASSAVTSA
ncbi:MAG: DegT/DnrJ/EryC1/StrS aminotransferase family protein [Pseudomonadota bacterium]